MTDQRRSDFIQNLLQTRRTAADLQALAEELDRHIVTTEDGVTIAAGDHAISITRDDLVIRIGQTIITGDTLIRLVGLLEYLQESTPMPDALRSQLWLTDFSRKDPNS